MLIYRKDQKNWENDTLLIAKDNIAKIMTEIGLDNYDIKPTTYPAYHPKKQADIMYDGKVIGFVGSLHPIVLKNNKIPESAGVTFVSLYMDDVAELTRNLHKTNYNFETLQDQIIYRDLCFVIDEQKDFSELINNIKSINEVKSIEIFDLYQGENLGDNKKSIALTIKIEGEGDMTTDSINAVMNKAIQIANKTGAVLRN